MRRIKQELSEEYCIQILEKQPRGFLAVNGDNNYPYALPINYVYYEGKIIFHSSLEGHKIDALKKNNKVSFTVINEGHKIEDQWYYKFESVIVFGKIKFIQNENEKYDKLMLLGNKYFPSEEYTKNEIDNFFERTLVIELDIEHMTGKTVIEK